MRDTEQEIDRLRRRLGLEAGGPLAQVSTQATESGEEHPLISILPAETGFALGRWDGHRA
jgi:hypothetical protein